MPAFCAGYFAGDLLFDIDGFSNAPAPVPRYVANTFGALTRGAPTRPSPFLKDRLLPKSEKHRGEWERMAQQPLFLIGSTFPDWHERVRGAPDGYNPALEFIEAILPTRLAGWAFIQQLIVPEYPLFRLLNAPGSVANANDERVDFFLPQADLVIEIDGGPHREPRQAWKDRNRDQYLARYGIETLRLATGDLRAENRAFDDFFAKLRQRCENSPRLTPYKTASAARKSEGASLQFDLTAIMRLQIAVIIGISHGQLDPAAPEWRLHVSQDFPRRDGPRWEEVALFELLDWFALFARLAHADFNPPKVVFAPDGLHFDIRLFERPDDRRLTKDCIVIRTSPVQDLPYSLGDSPKGGVVRIKELGISHLATTDPASAKDLPPEPSALVELCRRIFGHDNFRPGQEALILNALSGQKSLGLMPTGGGKSLCFQLPALLGSGTTITVVPIKALGRDHCAELEAAGFTGRVVNIDSDMPAPLRDQVYASRIRRGEMRFVFVSPERFQVDRFRDIVRALRSRNILRMFVIDEVHCMSEWGHDFRPSYLTLPGTLRRLADDVPVLGLTATASVNVLRDIQGEFQIPDELVAYEMHRSRTELNFSVRRGASSIAQIGQEIDRIVTDAPGNSPPPVHIFSRYANGKMGVESYATAISQSGLGLRVGSFSGSMPKDFNLDNAFVRLKNPDVPQPQDFEGYKKTVQILWKEAKLDVIVTTKAFGMGVNKPDVRHTLHAGMPSSMEAFYQEAGRAGRDRQPSYCHLLLRPEPDDASLIYEKLRANLTPGTINDAIERTTKGNPIRMADRGDFRSQLWFLAQGLIAIEEEEALVSRLHKVLESTPGESVHLSAEDISDLRHGAQRLQLTLYRLYQLGLIGPWSVTDWGRADGEDSSVRGVEVDRIHTSFAQSCTVVANRIMTIDGKSADLPALSRLRSLPDNGEQWPLLYRILLSWVRRKHLDSRLQSTWNLYSKSLAFTEERAEAFRDELEAFFKVDSNAFQLAALRDMPLEDVTTALEELIATEDGTALKELGALRKLSAQLARLLEGTQDNQGLNLAAAALALLTEETGVEARMRFAAAKTGGALRLWKGNGKGLLQRLAAANETSRETIGSWLVSDKPGRNDLLAIHEAIPARSVEVALFDDFAATLAATL